DYISRLEEVTECYNVSGAYDYLLKIYAPSMSAYQEFLLNKLGAFKELGAIESTFVMSELKHNYHLPF
ncbi:MAG: Lrp/AsnC ligand binding domain-containing protein, partial [Candidatus Amulumruptor sp.]|nr:Lrp/AsnC ligand binding domain-containing protein [Candidatus Amulumruptor sp.]